MLATGRSFNQDAGFDLLHDPKVLAIAEKHGKTPAQILIRHIVELGVVAIPKSVNPKRIVENFSVTDFELTKEDLAELDGLDKGSAARLFWFDVLPSDRSPRELADYPYNDKRDDY